MLLLLLSRSSSKGVDNAEGHSDELEDIVQQIRSLNGMLILRLDVNTNINTKTGELKYYEQLSGRRSVFDAEELEVISLSTTLLSMSPLPSLFRLLWKQCSMNPHLKLALLL